MSRIHSKFHRSVFIAGLIIAMGLCAAVSVSAQGSFDGHDEVEVQEFTPNDDGVVEIDFSNEGYQFLPTAVEVPVGSTIRITYESSGRHDWRLDEFDAATQVLGNGESETIEFTADSAGEYEFYCSVANHRARGMWGRFIVAE
ncbi:MAG: cupredoxin domain-containing protein [Spirochaeta sp.]